MAVNRTSRLSRSDEKFAGSQVISYFLHIAKSSAPYPAQTASAHLIHAVLFLHDKTPFFSKSSTQPLCQRARIIYQIMTHFARGSVPLSVFVSAITESRRAIARIYNFLVVHAAHLPGRLLDGAREIALGIFAAFALSITSLALNCCSCRRRPLLYGHGISRPILVKISRAGHPSFLFYA
jgi:hypothetical protein